MTSYNTSNISLPSLKWWVSSVSWAGPFYWNGSANTLVPFKISVLLIYEAGLTHLQKSLLRQPVSRQPGLSYKHSKNFIRTQGISRASRIKQASWANRAGSLHIKRPLTPCSHSRTVIPAPFLEKSKAARYRFRRVASHIVHVAGGLLMCVVFFFCGSQSKNYSRAVSWTKVEKENDGRGACVKMINGIEKNQKCKCGWENIKRVS